MPKVDRMGRLASNESILIGVAVSEYAIDEAQAIFPDLVRQVLRGEQVIIVSDGEQVAALVQVAMAVGQEVRQAIAAIKALRAGTAKDGSATINQAQFTEMRERGRR